MLVVGRFAGLVVAAKGDAGLILMQSNINKEKPNYVQHTKAGGEFVPMPRSGRSRSKIAR